MIFSWRYFERVATYYHVLMLTFLAGMVGFCLTGDIFDLFVWFELMGVSAYALTAYRPEERGPIQGALNFAITNSVGAYLSLSGYSRHWIIGPDDPGVGHVYQTITGGTSWTDISGNLPDIPANDIVLNGQALIAASDIGVYTSADNGSTWSRLGNNLPNVVVSQILVDPNGSLVAATHGRGIWTIPAP